MTKQRSILIFENSIKSDQTRGQYLYYLRKFKEYYKLRDYDSIIKIPQEKLQIMVEDYVMYLKKKVNPNSVPLPMFGIQSFLESNDIELRWKKIKRLYPAKIKKSGGKAWRTSEIQKMLQNATELRTRVLIHFLSASGVRIGALPDLQVRHLTRVSEDCYAILIYENSTEEYTTFLTPEASKILDEYLEKRKSDGEYISPNSTVFRIKYKFGIQKVKPVSLKSFHAVIGNLLHKSGLRTDKKGYRYDQQADHGFRKRWNTIVKTTDGMKIILAEKMFAHSTPTIPLDETYLDPTIEKLFAEYQKAIPELTISSDERQKIEVKKLQKEKTELEQTVEAKSNLKKIVDEQQKQLNDIKKTLAEYRERKIKEENHS